MTHRPRAATTLRVEHELYDTLRRRAAQERRSINSMVGVLLHQGLAGDRTPATPAPLCPAAL